MNYRLVMNSASENGGHVRYDVDERSFDVLTTKIPDGRLVEITAKSGTVYINPALVLSIRKLESA
jgi:hypothetical protein